MEIKKILLPVDGSECSMKACQHAAEMAKLSNAEIFLIHCHQRIPYIVEGQIQQAIDELNAASNKLLDPFREELRKSGVQFTDELFEGPTGYVISKIAKDKKCDLIVIGSRGKSDIQGLLLGSVTHRVLQTSPCPVLVIR